MSGALWITGVGLTTALGTGVEPTWSALVRGDRGIRPITLFDTSDLRVGLGAEVRDLPARPPARGGGSRTGDLAVGAAVEAMSMARLTTTGLRVGLVVGSTTGGLLETEDLLAQLHGQPDTPHAVGALLAYPLTGAAAAIESRVGPFARVRTLSSACSSGANAVVVAAGWLLSGEVDAVLAGGADSLCRLTLTGFNALMALDPLPCRPFDRRRQGTTLGEGAGFLVLERARGAAARGVDGLAELCGWASGAEAHHVTNPEPSGRPVAGLIEAALAQAGLDPSDVDYVNAHGTGTRANDSAEAAALRQVLGREVGRVPVSSSKGQLGHTLGAAGAIEAAITTLVVSRGVLVPTAGLQEPDAELGLHHVQHAGRPVDRVRAAVSNAFGFGGTNAVLVLRRADAVSRAVPFVPLRPVALTGAVTVSEDIDDLDADRSRRFDEADLRLVSAATRVLRDAAPTPAPCGLLVGTAFGTVDATAAFLHRVSVKGARFASPADFPHLLPSTSAGHASIYAGLTGPVFAVVDPSASAERAIVDAIRLVGVGASERMLAGSSGRRGGPVTSALTRALAAADPLCTGEDDALVVLVEDAGAATQRPNASVVRVDQVLEWRGQAAEGLAALRPPGSGSFTVFVARFEPSMAAAVAASPWGAGPSGAGAGGEVPQGLGARAFVVALGRMSRGEVRHALVWGAWSGGGFAVVLASHEGRAAR